MDMVLRLYSNKISHLTKCTNTRPKKIAKNVKTPGNQWVIYSK